MRPDDHDIDDELRTHLEISTKERIARGESPEAARLAALRELGYVPAVRESVHRVWYSRWWDALMALGQEMRVGMRSLLRAKGLTFTVVVTLALGIGANAAIFSVVRGVLLQPLVNRDEGSLVYIRQSAPGINTENTTFSVPEIDDLKARATTISAFGDFSVLEFTMLGVGDPRMVRAGVVSGNYFDVMGLRPVLGRLISPADDGEGAAPVVVLSHRFWISAFNSDPSVVGRTVRLGSLAPTVVGVVEPSVPYPTDTEIIANMVSSPHHLGATMNTERRHRMTELFARVAPGRTIDEVRSEIAAAHAAMVSEHPDTYAASANYQATVTTLREQITAPARTILIVLLAAAAVVFVIACSNVANLILARSVRREGELAVRAAIGASHGALRRTLLAESLVLCGAGAILGVLLAGPLVSIVARYAARFSVRALDVQLDGTVLWVGAGLAMAAAILLAYVPRLPSANAASGLGVAAGSIRITPGTNRRLRLFATAQIAFSFLLLAGAAALLASLLSLQSSNTGYNIRQVLAFDVPNSLPGTGPAAQSMFAKVAERMGELPGVRGVAVGSVVPWRDVGTMGKFPFKADGYVPANGEEDPYARLRFATPSFFAVLGVPLIAGREFNDDDRRQPGDQRPPVAIVNETVARRLFPNGDALNRTVLWSDPFMSRYAGARPRRIVGIVADVDDENVLPTAMMTIYQPTFDLGGLSGRLFVHVDGDAKALVPAITRVIRDVSPNQPVERAATLEEIRAQALSPDRLNTFVVMGFAGIALLIAVVGVAGVLAFSVSARMREFGVRLAIGSTPRDLLLRVVRDGAAILGLGIATGVVSGYVFAGLATSFIAEVTVPGAVPLTLAALVLGGAGVLASLLPAARASRVQVLTALRAE